MFSRYMTLSHMLLTLYTDIVLYDKSAYDGKLYTTDHLFSGRGTRRGAPIEQLEAYPITYSILDV
jgi:hypothetical protein